MSEFQILRNIMRRDYISLLKMANTTLCNEAQFNSMYRACLVQLFTVIEADIFGLRALDPYPLLKGVKKNFYDIFLHTFNQIARTWNKEEITEKYITTYFNELMLIKGERNNLTHPKKINALILPDAATLNRLEIAFKNYCDFMNEMMNGFYIGCKTLTIQQALEIQKESEAKGLSLKELIIKHDIIL